MTNPIIQEVRDARAALAAEHGYDHRKIFEWAKAKHAERQKEFRKSRDSKAQITTAEKNRDNIGR